MGHNVRANHAMEPQCVKSKGLHLTVYDCLIAVALFSFEYFQDMVLFFPTVHHQFRIVLPFYSCSLVIFASSIINDTAIICKSFLTIIH